MKGASYKGQYVPGQNIQKQVLKVQKLYQGIDNIYTDYINKYVNGIVETRQSHITIKDLNVSVMMKNKHLSKAVASQNFYESRIKLKNKCSCGYQADRDFNLIKPALYNTRFLSGGFYQGFKSSNEVFCKLASSKCLLCRQYGLRISV